MSGSGSRSRSVASPMMTSSTGSVALVLPTDPERPRPMVAGDLFDSSNEILFASMYSFDGHMMFILMPVSMLSMHISLSLRLSGAESCDFGKHSSMV